MDSSTIRRKYLDFFRNKGHQIVPSAPLVLKNDPSLLFTNSGMVQFKGLLPGQCSSRQRWIADTQKCLRVSGKHNDLEDVGLGYLSSYNVLKCSATGRSGTILKKKLLPGPGNFSPRFTNFQRTGCMLLSLAGIPADGLPVDEEAIALWKLYVKEDRILHGRKKIISGKWVKADPADRVQKFTSTFGRLQK